MKKTIKVIKRTFVIISVIWTTITLGFIGFLALSGPSSCSVDGVESENTIGLNSELPDFKFEEMDGEAIFTNESITGTYTLLYFWGTSCGVCIREMPHLYNAYTKLQNRDLRVIAVSYDRNKDNVREYMEKYPMPWRHTVVGVDRDVLNSTFQIIRSQQYTS
jgi:cytochrome oxidase Cu insertion factor (SCO1/SenC/PrrC family)